MTLTDYLQSQYVAPTKPVKMATAVGYWTDVNAQRQVHFINSETTPLPKRKLNKMTYLQLQDIAPDPGVVSLGCL